MYSLIEAIKGVRAGSPKLSGKRINIFDVVHGIYQESLNEYLEGFQISLEEATQSVNYCKNLQCKEDKYRKYIFNYCAGCILRSIDEGTELFSSKNMNIEEIEVAPGEKIVKIDDVIFLGSLEEYEEEERGRLGWKIAEEVHELYPILDSIDRNDNGKNLSIKANIIVPKNSLYRVLYFIKKIKQKLLFLFRHHR